MGSRTTFQMRWLGEDDAGILHIVLCPPNKSLCGHGYTSKPCLRTEGTPTCMNCVNEEKAGG